MREQIGFAAYLREALPNATFVGFTGTPIDLHDRSTEGVFGEIVDTYDMSKPGGLVVDYLGIGAELREALAQYRDRDQVRLDLDEAIRQTLMRLERAEAQLGGGPWRRFFGEGPAGRLTVLKRCLESVLTSGHRDEFLKRRPNSKPPTRWLLATSG